MRRDDANLALDAKTIADDGRDVVENLGQVATRLALNQNRRDEEAGVEQQHSTRELLQGIGQRHAIVLLVVEQLELGPDRLRHFFSDHRQTGRERVAGLERPRDERQRLGKLFLELQHPLGALIAKQRGRREGCRGGHTDGQQH